jgi:cation:H+ antiporter
MPWMQVLLGIVLLTIGGDQLVAGASRIALSLRITPMVVGLTVVAFGTSMPELVTSALAAWNGTPTLAVANIMGSNIANLALALPLGALATPLIVQVETIQRDLPIMVVATLLFVGVYVGFGLTAVTGGALLLTLLGVTVFQVRSARAEPADVQADWPVPEGARSVALSGLRVAIGLALLVGGGSLIVEGAVTIARSWGVAERVIGLTVVAIGTSAPEIATTLVAVYRGQADVAVGNAVGSNLFNLLGIGGVIGLLSATEGDPALAAFDAPVLVVFTLVAASLLRRKQTLSRNEAAALLLGYAAYLGVSIAG